MRVRSRRTGHFAVFGQFYDSALTTTEAARLLGQDHPRIIQRIRAGALLVLVRDGMMRLPVLQFHQGAEIPGLETVLNALPKRLGTLDILTWLAAPVDCLAAADGRPRSPRDALIQSGDVAKVVELSRDFKRRQI